MSVTDLAHAEREDLLALAESLTPAQWRQASLCPGWTVQDVVTHVVSYDGLPPGQLARLAATARGNPNRMNELLVERYRGATPEESLAGLRAARRPTGLTAGLGGRIGLTDGLIHRQDVRRPLGLGRDVPAERLTAALGVAMFAPPTHGAWRARGVRLRASDVDWAFGRGPEVVGPGEALLMASAGRASALADLCGPGLPRLRGHVATSN